jgi:hypothetical protein
VVLIHLKPDDQQSEAKVQSQIWGSKARSGQTEENMETESDFTNFYGAMSGLAQMS